jgi:uncharacterized protein YjbJ (UPF0337 family)
MNKDVLQGRWKEIRGRARGWWAELTDDDLNRVAGKWDVLVGLLQQKYGYTREKAIEDIDRRITDFEAGLKEHAMPMSGRK